MYLHNSNNFAPSWNWNVFVQLKSVAETMDTGRNLEQEEDMFGIIRESDGLDPGTILQQEEEHLDDFTGQFLNESGEGSDGIDVTDSSPTLLLESHPQR